MPIGVATIVYSDNRSRAVRPVSDGRQAQVAGRMSMRLMTIDLRPIAHAKVGDWSARSMLERPVECGAAIDCELTCAVAQRVRLVEK